MHDGFEVWTGPVTINGQSVEWEDGADSGVCRHCGDGTCVYDDPIPTCCADCSRSGCDCEDNQPAVPHKETD